jgi:hypothetical protein
LREYLVTQERVLERLARDSGVVPAAPSVDGPSHARRRATIKALDAARNALKLGKLEAAIDDMQRALNMAREEYRAERCATSPPPAALSEESWEFLP